MYDEPGHGCWLVSAEQMVKFLKDYFQIHDSKEHFLFDAAETAKIQKQKQGEFKIEPCRKFHVIRVNSEVPFGKVIFLRDNKIVENICSKDYEIEHHDDDNELEYGTHGCSC